MEKFQTKQTFWTILILAAAMASCISLYIGLHQSVWFDEAYSILLAEHSWSEIVRLTAADVHPPIYYWLLKAWMLTFDSSELALRSMSALLLGASIVVTGLLLRKLFSAKIALTALLFLVCAPFLLRYGFEIRMYALCTLIGVGATYILVVAVGEKQKTKRLLLFFMYALLVAIGVYTLYFMALVWMAHVVWIAYLAKKERRLDLLLYASGAYTFAVLLFAPWLPVFFSKAGGGTLSAVTSQLGPENLYGMVTYLFLYRPPWALEGGGVFVVLLILMLIIYIAVQGIKNATPAERQSLILLAVYFFVPVLVLIVVTHIVPIYIERYTAHVAIGLYALLGVLAALSLRSKKILPRFAAGSLLLVMIIGCVSLLQYGNYNFQRVHTPPIKEIAALLGECKNGAIIFADSPQLAMELMYYSTDCPVYFFNEMLEMGGGFAMLSGTSLRVADASELPPSDAVLYVYYDTPKRAIPDKFEKISTTSVGPVSVATFHLRPSAVVH